jgi:hypothetical protein
MKMTAEEQKKVKALMTREVRPLTQEKAEDWLKSHRKAERGRKQSERAEAHRKATGEPKPIEPSDVEFLKGIAREEAGFKQL